MNRAMDRFWRGVRKNAGMQLMTGNVTNAMQNLTGLSVALTKVKAKHLRNALAGWVGGPKAFVKDILERSAYMKQLTDNDISEMLGEIEELITNPNAFQKLQKFGQKHALVLQRMIQNPVNLITWAGAYEQAMEKLDANSEEDVASAVKEADAAVRLTQGAQGAENIARFEAGTPFFKIFTQFLGYFNNKANLLDSEYAITVRELGLKAGAGRLFGIYFFGHAVPAILASVILKALHGTWKDDDDDGYLDEWLGTLFGSQLREASGYLPVIGPALNTAFGAGGYNDRILSSPAIQLLEKLRGSPETVYETIEGDLKKRNVQDTLSVIGLLSGTPAGALGRPVGYLMDVEEGRAEPSGPLDFARGLLTGKRGE